MLLIPFSFLTAAALVMLHATWRLGQRRAAPPLHWIDAFFAFAAVQSILHGLRFGYAVESIRILLPVTAVLMPPLALLSFEQPRQRWHLALHLIPVLLTLLSIAVIPGLLDFIVPAVFVTYAALLARQGLAPESAMPWARLGDIAGSRMALWVLVAALMFSALADVIIAVDFARSGGANVAAVRLATQSCFVLLVCVLIWLAVPLPPPAETVQPAARTDSEDYQKDFDTVSSGLRELQLHLDPDLNLQRLARKTGVPAKRLSAAVNAIEGVNVSQWINGFRIAHAQQLLQDPDRLVSHVIYECGFNTKSSFNREFKRVTGTTPRQWRIASTGSPQ